MIIKAHGDLPSKAGDLNAIWVSAPENVIGRLVKSFKKVDEQQMAILAKKGEFSKEVHTMMLNLSYVPGEGLGKNHQGITEPICALPKWKGEGIDARQDDPAATSNVAVKKRKAMEIEEPTLDMDEKLAKTIQLNFVEDYLIAEDGESSGNGRGRGTGNTTDQPTSSTGPVPPHEIWRPREHYRQAKTISKQFLSPCMGMLVLGTVLPSIL